MNTKMATSSFALTCLLAAPALADVTAADVWANQSAYYTALGLTVSGELSGDTLMNPEMNIVLPLGAATAQIKSDDITMTQNGDGTVLISYPSPMKITVAGGVPNEASFSAIATITHDGYSVLVSGVPGDVTYTTSGAGLQIAVSDVVVDAPDAQGMVLEGVVVMDSWDATARITQGNMITYTSTSSIGETNTNFFTTMDAVTSTSVQKTLPLQSNVTMMLPVGGSDIMNLSAALRDGLGIMVQSTGAGSMSDQETTLNGDPMNRQITNTGAQTFAMTIDENGLAITSDAVDFKTVLNNPLVFPGDINIDIAAVDATYDIPLNASEEPQDFRLATSLSGITIGDSLWAMIDFSRDLNREPADISFDVTGSGTNGIDLLNIGALMALNGTPPIEVDQVTVENIRIAALGAEISAKGGFTFDWTDFQTIPGIARPEGTLQVNMNGVNGLLDKLGEIGLLPADQLMMPRMMLGMFATPVGDDMLETVLEVNDQGHVLANGQRLQ